MTLVRKESALQSRSVAGQLTHWARIGRAIEKSGSFDNQRIADALEAAFSPDDLTAEEQDVWFEEFVAKMTEPGTAEQAHFEKRRQLGRGVGTASSGQLVYQQTPKA